MTLTKALGIDENLLEPETKEAMQVAERIWQGRGSPRESNALLAALEEALTACQKSATRYPRVLLLRKKQIQRGEFFLEPPRADDGACKLCGGAGWYTTPDGTGSLCPCGVWNKNGR